MFGKPGRPGIVFGELYKNNIHHGTWEGVLSSPALCLLAEDGFISIEDPVTSLGFGFPADQIAPLSNGDTVDRRVYTLGTVTLGGTTRSLRGDTSP